MQQVTFAFDNEQPTPSVALTAEQQRALVELMAQAILAVLNHHHEEEHEST
jgi:hypothetical protein